MFPTIKLTYFKIDERGSAVRAALHVASIPFEDERIPFDETFHAIKHKFPFEKVPVLEVDGEVIAESQAMLRFVGRFGGLYPVNNPELALLIDEVLGAYDDMISMLVPSIKERDPQKKKSHAGGTYRRSPSTASRTIGSALAASPAREKQADRCGAWSRDQARRADL
ncbi:hypothetical protein PINS_up016934 [Pythium insidiosum]|nr:hypothetical protein PINS_up016934 [Pythium insidiosum]